MTKNAKMNLNQRTLLCGLSILLVSNAAMGQAMVTTVGGGSQITNLTSMCSPAASPAGAFTCGLFFDSSADVSLIDASLSVPLGSVSGTDFLVDTPGSSSYIPALSTILTGSTVSILDFSDDGPQTNFQWATITLIPDAAGDGEATLNAEIQTANTPLPTTDTVAVTIKLVPEPDSLPLVGLAIAGMMMGLRRRR